MRLLTIAVLQKLLNAQRRCVKSGDREINCTSPATISVNGGEWAYCDDHIHLAFAGPCHEMETAAAIREAKEFLNILMNQKEDAMGA